MPIYMDVHRGLGDVTEEDIRAAHARDLAVQDEFGVRFLTFWFNQPDEQAGSGPTGVTPAGRRSSHFVQNPRASESQQSPSSA